MVFLVVFFVSVCAHYFVTDFYCKLRGSMYVFEKQPFVRDIEAIGPMKIGSLIDAASDLLWIVYIMIMCCDGLIWWSSQFWDAFRRS